MENLTRMEKASKEDYAQIERECEKQMQEKDYGSSTTSEDEFDVDESLKNQHNYNNYNLKILSLSSNRKRMPASSNLSFLKIRNEVLEKATTKITRRHSTSSSMCDNKEKSQLSFKSNETRKKSAFPQLLHRFQRVIKKSSYLTSFIVILGVSVLTNLVYFKFYYLPALDHIRSLSDLNRRIDTRLSKKSDYNQLRMNYFEHVAFPTLYDQSQKPIGISNENEQNNLLTSDPKRFTTTTTISSADLIETRFTNIFDFAQQNIHDYNVPASDFSEAKKSKNSRNMFSF
jgi:hypothetical protein